MELKLGSLESWNWEQLAERHRELQGKADRGEPLEQTPDLTFAAYADDWLSRAKRRVRSFTNEKTTVEKSLKPYLGHIGLRQLSTIDVNRWIAKRLAMPKPERSRTTVGAVQPIKPGTVRREFNTLRAILNDAVRSGLIEKSPTQNADPIRGAVARQRFLTVEELIKLIAVAGEQAEWLPDFILWAVHSGMRKGEIQALKWSDVRELGQDRVVITVRQSKSGKPRMVIATKTMREVLERQKGRRMTGDDRVFAVSKMTLRRRWEAARGSADLQDATIHDLRRTHTTHAAASGVDLRTLAGRIGHADLTMIERVYAQAVGSASWQAAENTERAFALGPAGSMKTAEGTKLRRLDAGD